MIKKIQLDFNMFKAVTRKGVWHALVGYWPLYSAMWDTNLRNNDSHIYPLR